MCVYMCVYMYIYIHTDIKQSTYIIQNVSSYIVVKCIYSISLYFNINCVALHLSSPQTFPILWNI